MKVLLDIKDNKAELFMEFIESISYVKAKTLTDEKAQLMSDISDAVNEVKLIREGKMKGIPAKDLLNDL